MYSFCSSRTACLLDRPTLQRLTLSCSVNNNKSTSKVLHRLLQVQPDRALTGSGVILKLSNGKEIIDASGGAAVACIGHGNRRVAEAIQRQAQKLAYVHTG